MLTIPDDAWYQSSRSAGATTCAEVAHGGGRTAARASTRQHGPTLPPTHPRRPTLPPARRVRARPLPRARPS